MIIEGSEYDRVEALLRELGAYLIGIQSGLSEVREKGALDLVTEADLEVERRICAFIEDAFPEDLILAEENARIENATTYGKRIWVIDPLDGTVNYASGSPIYAISLGMLEDGVLKKGWVYAPVLNELFFAELGRGAYFNGGLIDVSERRVTPLMSLSSGFLSTISEGLASSLKPWLNLAKFRNIGSQALQLCYVACGRLAFNINWEAKFWDDCAGAIIVAESKACYQALGCNWQGSDLVEVLRDPEIHLQSLACHPSLLKQVNQLLEPYVRSYDKTRSN